MIVPSTRLRFCAEVLLLILHAANAGWRPTNGPGDVAVNLFAVGDSAILSGSEFYGVFRSTDGGTSWAPADSGLPIMYPGNAHPVYALAERNGIFFAGTDSGVYRSIDNGVTWEASNTGFPEEGPLQVSTVAVAGGTVFAGFYGAFAGKENNVFRSTDNGAHWTAIGGGFGSTSYLQCIIANGNSLFAGLWKRGVWRSTDNGNSWTATGSVLQDASMKSLTAGGGAVFARTDSGRIFRSVDDGTSWTPADSGLPPSVFHYIHRYPLLMNGATLFAGTDSGVFRSTDRGLSWTAADSGVSHLRIQALAANGNFLLAGTDNSGIFRSTDNGLQWKSVNSGLANFNSTVNTLSVAGSVLLAGIGDPGDRSTTINVYASGDNGVRWSALIPGFANDNATADFFWSLMQGGVVLAGISDNGLLDSSNVFLSTDGGDSWTRVDSGLVQAHTWKYELYTCTSNANVLFIGTKSGLLHSTDSGATWKGPDTNLRENPIYSLMVNNGKIIAGTGGGVYVSSDNGILWKKVPFGLTGMRVEALTTCGTALFAGSSYNGVFRSTDNGENWEAVNAGLSNTSVFSLISHDSTLFAGTFGNGVFFSSDNGANWAPFNTGLTAVNVLSLAVNNEELFAGTDDRYIWHRPLSETAAIADHPQRITTFRQTGFDILAPGPANPYLRVTFSVANPDRVVITLYNISGRKVASIFNRRADAGSSTIQWDARAMAQGCYVLAMQGGGKNSASIVRFDR